MSERRVAELAAEGRSNPEVAQALFVSRATVQSHLRTVFLKLDVTSRDQIASRLAEKSSSTLNDANRGPVKRRSRP